MTRQSRRILKSRKASEAKVSEADREARNLGGRPPLDPEVGRMVLVASRIPDWQAEWIQERATGAGKKTSEIVRELIASAIASARPE